MLSGGATTFGEDGCHCRPLLGIVHQALLDQRAEVAAGQAGAVGIGQLGDFACKLTITTGENNERLR